MGKGGTAPEMVWEGGDGREWMSGSERGTAPRMVWEGGDEREGMEGVDEWE